MNKSVDDYLNEVSYAEDPNYVPSTFAVKFIDFIKMVNDGRGESSPSPTFHYKMLDSIANKDERIANLASRGTAKTSIFAEYLILYIAVYGEIDGFGIVDAIIYVSDTVENGVKSLKKNIEYRYEHSEFLQKYVPEVVFNQTELWFTNASGTRTGVRMFGASTGIRGTKILAKRPQLAIFDDLLSDKNAKSDGIIESIEDTLFKGANHALDPTHRKMIFSGTPFHQGDPLYKAIESGAWVSNVYPICEEFPCSREEFQGAWPERFTYDFVRKEYESAKLEGQLHAFNQELMLRITSEEDRLIENSEILWYDRDLLLQNKHNYNFYVTTDFATSEKRSADFSGISVWAINSHNHRFWVDGILKKQTMDLNIDDLFRLCHKYEPLGVGIETNGQQGGFIPWIQKEQLSRNIYFPIAKSIRANGKGSLGIASPTNTNKLERFNTVLPLFKQGKVHLPEQLKEDAIMVEAVKELKGIMKKGIVSRYDDWLDTVSQMGLMEMFTPSKYSTDGSMPLSGDSREGNFWGTIPLDNPEEDTNNSYFV